MPKLPDDLRIPLKLLQCLRRAQESAANRSDGHDRPVTLAIRGFVKTSGQIVADLLDQLETIREHGSHGRRPGHREFGRRRGGRDG